MCDFSCSSHNCGLALTLRWKCHAIFLQSSRMLDLLVFLHWDSTIEYCMKYLCSTLHTGKDPSWSVFIMYEPTSFTMNPDGVLLSTCFTYQLANIDLIARNTLVAMRLSSWTSVWSRKPYWSCPAELCPHKVWPHTLVPPSTGTVAFQCAVH